MVKNLISEPCSIGDVLSADLVTGAGNLSLGDQGADPLDRLRAKGSYTCRVCGLKVIGRAANPPVCVACKTTDRDREVQNLSKTEALGRAVCPLRYRGLFDPALVEYQGPGGESQGWPTDCRTGGLSLANWRGRPNFITLLGPNGTGKSALAAELMYRLHREGHIATAWLRPAQIHQEDRETALGQPRQFGWRALTASVLVLDELGHGCPIEAVAEIIEARWSGGKVTIFTSHRTFKQGKCSIASEAPMIYDRLRDGGVYALAGESKRGLS